MCTFSLNSTPSSVVTDPSHLLLTAHLFVTGILLVYYRYLRIRAGAPLAVGVNSIMAGSKSPKNTRCLYTHQLAS